MRLTTPLTTATLITAILVSAGTTPPADASESSVPAGVATTEVALGVNGGSLTIAQVGASGFTLPPAPNESGEVEWSAGVLVRDDRGTGQGWQVNVSGVEYEPISGGPSASFPTAVTSVTPLNNANSTNTAPVDSIAMPVSVPNNPGHAATVYDAQPGTGLGNFTLELQGIAEIPNLEAGASATAGYYEPVLNLEEVSGP